MATNCVSQQQNTLQQQKQKIQLQSTAQSAKSLYDQITKLASSYDAYTKALQSNDTQIVVQNTQLKAAAQLTAAWDSTLAPISLTIGGLNNITSGLVDTYQAFLEIINGFPAANLNMYNSQLQLISINNSLAQATALMNVDIQTWGANSSEARIATDAYNISLTQLHEQMIQVAIATLEANPAFAGLCQALQAFNGFEQMGSGVLQFLTPLTSLISMMGTLGGLSTLIGGGLTVAFSGQITDAAHALGGVLCELSCAYNQVLSSSEQQAEASGTSSTSLTDMTTTGKAVSGVLGAFSDILNGLNQTEVAAAGGAGTLLGALSLLGVTLTGIGTTLSGLSCKIGDFLSGASEEVKVAVCADIKGIVNDLTTDDLNSVISDIEGKLPDVTADVNTLVDVIPKTDITSTIDDIGGKLDVTADVTTLDNFISSNEIKSTVDTINSELDVTGTVTNLDVCTSGIASDLKTVEDDLGTLSDTASKSSGGFDLLSSAISSVEFLLTALAIQTAGATDYLGTNSVSANDLTTAINNLSLGLGGNITLAEQYAEVLLQSGDSATQTNQAINSATHYINEYGLSVLQANQYIAGLISTQESASTSANTLTSAYQKQLTMIQQEDPLSRALYQDLLSLAGVSTNTADATETLNKALCAMQSGALCADKGICIISHTIASLESAGGLPTIAINSLNCVLSQLENGSICANKAVSELESTISSLSSKTVTVTVDNVTKYITTTTCPYTGKTNTSCAYTCPTKYLSCVGKCGGGGLTSSGGKGPGPTLTAGQTGGTLVGEAGPEILIGTELTKNFLSGDITLGRTPQAISTIPTCMNPVNINPNININVTITNATCLQKLQQQIESTVTTSVGNALRNIKGGRYAGVSG
jgi:hypothetical protein